MMTSARDSVKAPGHYRTNDTSNFLGRAVSALSLLDSPCLFLLAPGSKFGRNTPAIRLILPNSSAPPSNIQQPLTPACKLLCINHLRKLLRNKKMIQVAFCGYFCSELEQKSYPLQKIPHRNRLSQRPHSPVAGSHLSHNPIQAHSGTSILTILNRSPVWTMFPRKLQNQSGTCPS